MGAEHCNPLGIRVLILAEKVALEIKRLVQLKRNTDDFPCFQNPYPVCDLFHS
jgi:hypothetical protein